MSNATTPFEWILENLLVNGHKITLEYAVDSEHCLTKFFLRVNGRQGPGFAGENLRIIGELIIDSAIEGAFKRIDGGVSEEIECPGCQQEITPENAGGYRTFCMDCVKKFPDFPTAGRSYTIEITGTKETYPEFKWVTHECSDSWHKIPNKYRCPSCDELRNE